MPQHRLPALNEAMHSDIIHTATSSEESIVLFELSHQRGQTRAISHHPQELATKSAKALGQAMGTVQALANRTTETIAKLPNPPSSFELDFGIKMDAEVGAIVSKSSGEANLRIKLTWTSEAEG
ncbi:MAG: CU044_2847 family protein [Cyanobacteria bacterium P01_F01_bin.86]